MNPMETKNPASNDNRKIKVLTRSYYDTQKLRIQAGNRIVASIRPDIVDDSEQLPTPLRIIPSQKPANEMSEEELAAKEKKEKEDAKLIKKVYDEFKMITDVYVQEFKGRGSVEKSINRLGEDLAYVKSITDYSMVQMYSQLQETEQNILQSVTDAVKDHPMWNAFFKDAPGCGPLMAAVILSNVDIHKARFPSSIWRYAGLDVVNGEGRNKKHRSTMKYTDKEGVEREMEALGYNPELKTKLCGVLGGSFLKAGRDSKYAKIYYDYKNRLNNRIDTKDFTPMHKHRMATRYAVKLFLSDMWAVWRKLEGYDIGQPYAEAYLGRKPHHYNEAMDGTSAS